MVHCFFQIIASLALVIYSALDFGLRENEERTLTPGLENLLDLMLSRGERVEKVNEMHEFIHHSLGWFPKKVNRSTIIHLYDD